MSEVKKVRKVKKDLESGVFDIHNVCHHINRLTGLDCYNFYESDKHFHIWCDAKGYGKIDSTGAKRSQSNVWFKEYQKDSEGMQKCPPYVSLWSFVLNVYTYSYGEVFTFEVADIRSQTKDTKVNQFLDKLEEVYGSSFECVFTET